MKYPRICKAKAINDHTLVIEFTNQEIKKYDIVHLLENPMFAPLRQPAFFKNFKVEEGGYGIVWNENVDLSEYELWKNGMTVVEGDSVEEHPVKKRRSGILQETFVLPLPDDFDEPLEDFNE